ncbi:MAG: SGNH/GDSL hydrolase family protein [Candidatus Nitrosotenuis sp.]
MKLSRLLSIFLFNLLLLLIGLFLLEIICRVAGIPYKQDWTPNEYGFARFDHELGWSYIPHKSAINKTGDVEIPVYFDENGIRIPRPDFKFDYLRPSILFIGDSFTMGHGLLYEDSFVGRFSQFKEVQYQVVNLGVQGYGSDQALLTLKKFLSRFNAKIVVYTFIEDHILRNGNYDRRTLIPTARFIGTKPLFALDKAGKLYLKKKPVLYKDYINSYLLDFLKIRIGKALGLFPPYPVNLTREIIKEMKKYSENNGAYFVVINWRWTEKDNRKIFQDLDVDLIDTLKDSPPGWSDMRLFGGVHPNAEASKHVAKLLLDYFKEKGLLRLEKAS